MIPSAGGFLFEGMSDDEEEFQSVSLKISCSLIYTYLLNRISIVFFHLANSTDLKQGNRSGPSSSSAGSSGLRPASLGYSGAVGPRPITQSELATALALASTPESSAVTPTIGNQVHSFIQLILIL